MQNKIVFIFLFFLGCANVALAQEPQWELFFPDLSGPISVDPTDSDIIYIASGKAFEEGMWKTTDGGQTWNLYSEGWGMGTPRDILIHPDNPQEILVSGGPFVGIHKSVDGGQTWIRADSGFIVDHHGYQIVDLAFDTQRRVFYAADFGTSSGVFQSTDGVHWRRTTPSYPFDPLTIVIDEENDVIYAGSGNGVWKSLDAGSTWAQVINGLPIESPTPPVTYPVIWNLAKINHSQTLYCVVSNLGIYKSYNGGDNWFSVNDSVTSQLSFRGGLVVSETDTNVVFAGSRFSSVSIVRGIYQTRDGGRNWEQYNLGLPEPILNFATRNLFLDHHTNSLFADIALFFGNARAEEGIYRLVNAIITNVSKQPERIVVTNLVLKAYPNPFNIQTTLVYTVHTKGQLTLQIFNIVGNEVVRLIDKKVGPGEYRIHWDGTNQAGRIVPSGIYLARVQLGREAATIKLLVQK